jgi:hypothetical protein
LGLLTSRIAGRSWLETRAGDGWNYIPILCPL